MSVKFYLFYPQRTSVAVYSDISLIFLSLDTILNTFLWYNFLNLLLINLIILSKTIWAFQIARLIPGLLARLLLTLIPK